MAKSKEPPLTWPEALGLVAIAIFLYVTGKTPGKAP